MAQEIGTGYIQIIPTAKGLGKSIEDPINNAVSNASKNSGSTITSRIGGAFQTVGKIGLAAVATLTGGIAALTAKGGIDRALNIERAQTKLKALGHDTQSVDQIMDDALASVKGTAYGLGDAASVAATLVASGIKQGGDLQTVLTTVGDTAQIAGSSFTDMGVIFSQVAAKGKLQGDEMLQLMQAGIPVLQYLADHYHTTTAAAQEMVSDGLVSFQDFEAAMREHIGGAAQSAGESFDGAMGNVRAALSRLGETVATPVINGLTTMANQAIPIIDDFTERAKPVLERIGSALQRGFETAVPVVLDILQQINGVIQRIPDAAQQAKARIDEIVSELQTASPAIAAVTGAVAGAKGLSAASTAINAVGTAVNTMKGHLGGVSMLMLELSSAVSAAGGPVKALFNLFAANPIGVVVTAVGALVAGLVAFFTQTETGRQLLEQFMNWLTPVFNNLLAVWTPIWQQVQSVITTVWNAVSSVASTALGEVWGFIQSVLPQIQAIWSDAWELVQAIVSRVWTSINATIVPILQSIWSIVSTVVSMIADYISEHMDTIQAIWESVWGMISSYVQGVWNNIKTIVQTVLGVIQGVIRTVTAVIKGDWQGAWDGIKQIVSSIWDGIKGVISNTISMIMNVISNKINMIKATWTAVWNGISTVASNTWNTIKSLVSTAINTVSSNIRSVMQSLSGIWSSVWNGIAGTASSIWGGIAGAVSAGIGTVVSLVSSLPGRIGGVFANAGSLLLDAGRNIIQGLINGISNAVGSAVSAVKNAVSSVVEGAKDFLGIHSPSTVFRDEIGRMVGEGFAIGIRRETDTVRDAGDRLAESSLPDSIHLPGFDASSLRRSMRTAVAAITVAPTVTGVGGGRAETLLERIADAVETRRPQVYNLYTDNTMLAVRMVEARERRYGG